MRARIIAGAAALALLASGPVAAQRGQMDPGRRGGADRIIARMAPGAVLDRQVEAALDRRDRLGLTEQQVQDLERLRSDIEATFGPLRTELAEGRSQARDRSGDREEVRARMTEVRERQRALRARVDTLRSPLQARFEQIVPPLQRQELQRGARGARGVGVVGRRIAAQRGVGLRAGRAPARAVADRFRSQWQGPRAGVGARFRPLPRDGRGDAPRLQRRPMRGRGGGR